MSTRGSEVSPEELSTPNQLRERVDTSGALVWATMTANRKGVTVALAAFVFCGVLGFGAVTTPPLPVIIRNSTVLMYLFSAMIGVIVTGSTFVVTISQLIVSEENGTLGDQRQRMSDTMDFRQYTSELLGGPAPSAPSAFLVALVNTVERRAETLDRVVDEGRGEDDDLRRQVDAFVDSVHDNSQETTDQLAAARFGSFDLMHAALNFNYSWKLSQVERMIGEFDTEMNEDEVIAFDDLKTALTMFGPAREHIKTLYFEWELINLSRYIVYTALPALVVAGGMLIFFNAQTAPGATFGIPNVTWIVTAAFTATALPFLVFASYIVRIITIAKRTLAIGPFSVQKSQR